MIEIYMSNVYEVQANNSDSPDKVLVRPIENRIREDGFDGCFYYRGRWSLDRYSFLNSQVIKRVCWDNEMEYLFPEDFV